MIVALSIRRAAESAHPAAPVRVGPWTDETEETGADSVVTGAEAQAVQKSRRTMSLVIRRGRMKSWYERLISGQLSQMCASKDELT